MNISRGLQGDLLWKEFGYFFLEKTKNAKNWTIETDVKIFDA